MREALGSLTLRGRAFLGAGVTATVGALVAGQPTIVRAGLLALALPLISGAVLLRSQYRIALGRRLAHAHIPAGGQTEITLSLTNEGRTPTGLLRLEEQLPYALGARPRFVLEGVGRGWRRTVSYPVRADHRGRFTIGPMQVEVGDPFGMVRLHREFASTATLVVTPRVVDLPAVAFTGGWAGAGDNRTRAFAVGSAEDVTVRDYRRGDDLRRVHWRSSARAGELMVRREEQPWQARATLLLDNRAQAHVGHGAASSLETAVSLVASIARHLAQRGYAVRLATAATHEAWHDHTGAASTEALIDQLAVVETVPGTGVPLDTSWLSDHGEGGLLIAVLGAIGESDAVALRRLRQHVGVAAAVVLDTASWSGGTATSSPGSPVAAVTAAGWCAVPHRHDDRFETTWTALARSVSARGSGMAASGALR